MIKLLQRFYFWLRFGIITKRVRAVDGGVESEIEYLDRWGNVVGYWAYGYFYPGMPYQGQIPPKKFECGTFTPL